MECQVIYLQHFQDFHEKVLYSDLKSVFLVFVAEWCPPSISLVKSLRKELESQRKRLATHGQSEHFYVPIYVVDVDKPELKEVVKQFSPSILPYVYLFESGKKGDQVKFQEHSRFIGHFGGMDQLAIQKIALKSFEKLV